MNSWMLQGLCREVGPDPFFGDKGYSARLAKRICARCEVSEQCLDYAMTTRAVGGAPLKGVWGGTTERDRRQMRQLREVS